MPTLAPPRIPLEIRVWSKIKKRGPDECWPWLGQRQMGRGQIRLPGRDGGKTSAARVVWTLTFGPIPNGLHVLHSCDNPPCCNPAHLFLGTNLDNIADKVAKGRQCLGVRNAAAKLSEEQVVEMRRRHLAGESLHALARAFSVSRRTVQFAVRGRTWSHIALERQAGAYGY